jgi:hypothetical protein
MPIYFPHNPNDLPTYPVPIPDLGCYRAAMGSPAQIAANRLNATKSTGPRTEAGKTASRMNALQHGIDAHASVLPGEDPDAYQALADDYRHHYKPATVEQSFLVETLIQSDWNRRRYARIQSELTARLLDEQDPDDRSVAALFMPDSKAARALHRVIRYLQAAQNAWFRALKELERIQKLDFEAAALVPLLQGSENWLRSVPPLSAPSATPWSVKIPQPPPPPTPENLGAPASQR